jgi:hypothetical protein
VLALPALEYDWRSKNTVGTSQQPAKQEQKIGQSALMRGYGVFRKSRRALRASVKAQSRPGASGT